MVTVNIKNLDKSFGNMTAVKDFSMQCEEGELLFVLGPSGAGKTTTLMLIAGLIDADAGKIIIKEREVQNLQPWERNVSMAFESYALYPHYSVYENLAFPLKSPRQKPKLNQQEIKAEVTKITNMLKINDLLERKPGQLSGGQRQRVSLGRVLVRNADLYLLDEPLLHLDAKLRYEMMGELRSLQKELNTSMIMVGPDFVEALTIADRIVIVNMGMIIQQEGNAEEIYKRPANLFVADSIGEPSINLFECNVNEENGILYLITDQMKIRVPDEKINALSRRIKREEKVIMGVRPGDLQFDEKAIDGCSATGCVSLVEPLGWSDLVECKIGKDVAKIVSGVNSFQCGDNININFDAEKMLFFDKESGMLIN